MGRPQRVRVVRPDGTEVPCELIHEGIDEETDMDNWRIAGVTFRVGLDQIKVGMLPARTGISFEVEE
jgi:hypothetical protein